MKLVPFTSATNMLETLLYQLNVVEDNNMSTNSLQTLHGIKIKFLMMYIITNMKDNFPIMELETGYFLTFKEYI